MDRLDAAIRLVERVGFLVVLVALAYDEASPDFTFSAGLSAALFYVLGWVSKRPGELASIVSSQVLAARGVPGKVEDENTRPLPVEEEPK